MKILLLILPSYIEVYSKAKIHYAVPGLPLLSTALLARVAQEEGSEVKITDLSLAKDFKAKLAGILRSYKPDLCGYGFTTPLYQEALDTARIIRDTLPEVKIACGGVHPSLFPDEILRDFPIDYVCIGEGENTLRDLIQNLPLRDIKGLAFKENGRAIINTPRERLTDLDSLPMPAWELYDLKSYYYPKLNVKSPPALPLMTSRGCVYKCSFCTKKIHGSVFRKMSPERVIEEIKYIKSVGAGEFHIWDDQFTTDLNRAKTIAELLIKNNIRMKWNMFIGVRVDTVDREFLKIAKRSGLYQIAFAPESASPEILNEIHKNIIRQQSIDAFNWCRDLGIETVAFFVIGFINETKQTIKDTIDFACQLNPDYAKTTIALPLPKTEFYYKVKDIGLIKSYDWSKYNFHIKHEVWEHPSLNWEELYSAYNKFFRKFYLRPSYMFKALKRSIKNKTLAYELKNALTIIR